MPDTLRAPDQPLTRARGMARAVVNAIRETPSRLKRLYSQAPASRPVGGADHDPMTDVTSTMQRGARGLKRVLGQVRDAAR